MAVPTLLFFALSELGLTCIVKQLGCEATGELEGHRLHQLSAQSSHSLYIVTGPETICWGLLSVTFKVVSSFGTWDHLLIPFAM